MSSHFLTSSLGNSYRDFSDFTKDYLGFDPVILVNTSLTIAACFTFFTYAAAWWYHYFQKIFTTVVIDELDDVYHAVIRWIYDHKLNTYALRSVRAVSSTDPSWQNEDDAIKLLAKETSIDRLINYRSIIGQLTIVFQPFRGWFFFRYNGHWILFQQGMQRNGLLLQTQDPARFYIQLQCFGFSLTPIRDFLEAAAAHTSERTTTVTNVFRAIANSREHLHWSKIISRPSRDIRTVILERQKKHALLQDINEYLHPRTRRWVRQSS
jgi:chaperone BCS1